MNSVAFVVLAATFCAGTFIKVYDADLFWHLRTGQLIFETGAVPHTDPFSASAAGSEWVAQEWLWELLAYGVWRVGGWLGLSVARMACVAGAIWFAMLVARRRGSSWTSITVAATILACPLLAYAEIRPQATTFLMFSLVFWMLEVARRRPRVLFGLPAVFLLWANLHGAFLAGLMLLACEAVSLAPWHRARTRRERSDPARAAETRLLKVLGICAAACVLVALANPAGFGLYTYPLKVVTEPLFRSRVYEWTPPNFTRPFWPFWGVFVLVVCVLVAQWQMPNRGWGRREVALFVFAVLALRARRQVPFFCLLAIPAFSAGLDRLLLGRSNALLRYGALVLAAGVSVFSFVAYRGARGPMGVGITPGRFPEEAAARLLETGMAGTVYNDYNDGGYLVWRLWPRWKIVMDGRVDVYGPALVERYARTWGGAADWREDFRKWGVRAVLGRHEIKRASPRKNLYTELEASTSWRRIYRDRTSELWLPADAVTTASKPVVGAGSRADGQTSVPQAPSSR